MSVIIQMLMISTLDILDIYVSLFPCNVCSKLIIQSQLSQVSIRIVIHIIIIIVIFIIIVILIILMTVL